MSAPRHVRQNMLGTDTRDLRILDAYGDYSKMTVLRIIECVNGEPTEFDGKLVAAYDPSYVHPEGYDGGILEVTDDPAEALQFTDAAAALECWRQSYGMRYDGQPNRPLTAWTVSVESI